MTYATIAALLALAVALIRNAGLGREVAESVAARARAEAERDKLAGDLDEADRVVSAMRETEAGLRIRLVDAYATLARLNAPGAAAAYDQLRADQARRQTGARADTVPAAGAARDGAAPARPVPGR